MFVVALLFLFLASNDVMFGSHQGSHFQPTN